MKNVFIYNNSVCVRRLLDATKIYNYFLENNCRIVTKPKDADIIIFVSCAVFNEMAFDSLKMIRKFQKYDAEMIVAGCLPAINREHLDKIFKGKTMSTKELRKIDNFFPENTIKFGCIDSANVLYKNLDTSTLNGLIKDVLQKRIWAENIFNKVKIHILRSLFDEKSFIYNYLSNTPKFYISVSRGCFGNCSYCAIKKAIGEHKSKPLDQCLNELKKGLDQDFKKIVITADDIGAYGMDIGSSFPELLDEMTKIPGEFKISIMGLNPKWIVKYVEELEGILKKQKIASITIPIQSGNNRILKLMNRYSNVEKIKNSILRLKESFPELLLHTGMMVGFPTETKEEFKQTLSFVTDMNFINGAFNPFSCKTDTKAEDLNPKISRKEIYHRLKYSKKFFKNNGYLVKYIPKAHVFLFEQKKAIRYVNHEYCSLNRDDKIMTKASMLD